MTPAHPRVPPIQDLSHVQRVPEGFESFRRRRVDEVRVRKIGERQMQEEDSKVFVSKRTETVGEILLIRLKGILGGVLLISVSDIQ